MDLAQESDLVLSVSRGKNKQWHVTAHDFRQPLTTFDNPQAACAWAIARAKLKRGRVFLEGILVTWSDNGGSLFKSVRSQNNVAAVNPLAPSLRGQRGR